MGLFKLNYSKEDLSDGFLEKANKKPIDYEKNFEDWLENSPHVLFERDNETIMWIGRQVSANSFETTKFPDLIGIDSNGNVVILELKKGKTPRDVVAQLLEYGAWGSMLSYEELNILTMKYYDNDSVYQGMELREIHNLIFYPDYETTNSIEFNKKIRLYIIAEEISKSVRSVVKYLNEYGKIDISYMEYEVFRAGNGEFYISTEPNEAEIPNIKPSNNRINTFGWNKETPVKKVVKIGVDKALKDKSNGIFTAKEVISQVLNEYPDCNKNTIRCQIYADCVNHTSRKHYKGGQLDLYYYLGNGQFRLYNKQSDGNWDVNGEQIL